MVISHPLMQGILRLVPVTLLVAAISAEVEASKQTTASSLLHQAITTKTRGKGDPHLLVSRFEKLPIPFQHLGEKLLHRFVADPTLYADHSQVPNVQVNVHGNNKLLTYQIDPGDSNSLKLELVDQHRPWVLRPQDRILEGLFINRDNPDITSATYAIARWKGFPTQGYRLPLLGNSQDQALNQFEIDRLSFDELVEWATGGDKRRRPDIARTLGKLGYSPHASGNLSTPTHSFRDYLLPPSGPKEEGRTLIQSMLVQIDTSDLPAVFKLAASQILQRPTSESPKDFNINIESKTGLMSVRRVFPRQEPHHDTVMSVSFRRGREVPLDELQLGTESNRSSGLKLYRIGSGLYLGIAEVKNRKGGLTQKLAFLVSQEGAATGTPARWKSIPRRDLFEEYNQPPQINHLSMHLEEFSSAPMNPQSEYTTLPDFLLERAFEEQKEPIPTDVLTHVGALIEVDRRDKTSAEPDLSQTAYIEWVNAEIVPSVVKLLMRWPNWRPVD